MRPLPTPARPLARAALAVTLGAALGGCAPAGAPSPDAAPDTIPVAPGRPGPAEARPNPAAMDRSPARRALSPNGAWDVRVAEGGALTVRRPGAPDTDVVALDAKVDPRLTFAGDTLYYAREGAWGESDLWRVTLPDGTPEPVTTWPGSEDRPVVSPDGRRLAFVSGRTGFASWWVVDLAALPAVEGRQITNVGIVRGRPGEPPEGWIPVPDGVTYAWTAAGLTWVAEQREWTAPVDP